MNNRPNIIFFFSDQQRWDTVGCYGQKLAVTPNLDTLAEEGVKFENAFSCQPICGPARACIQTGQYATQTGCFRNDIPLPVDTKTIANYFSESGYEVGYIGKWHLASERGNEEANFKHKPVPPELRGGYKDYWLASDLLEFTSHGYDGYMFDQDMNKVEFKGYRVDCVTDFALEYLESRKQDKPLFLMISYIEPHHQNDHNRYEGPEGSKERFKDYEVPGDLLGTEGDWKENYADYLGCCRSLDDNLGRLRKKLNDVGMGDNTVILYTADHGSHFRTRNAEYKRSCHEASIRLPMIAWGPGFTGGKVVNELVSLIDVPPTLLACAGISKPDIMQGNPMQQLAEGAAQNWPEEVFVQISESHTGRCIRTKQWKYSVGTSDPVSQTTGFSEMYEEQFLYNLETDPYEKNNLVTAKEYKEIRSELALLLKKHMSKAGEKEPIILPCEKD